MEQRFSVDPEQMVRFHNGADFCVGTGRMGLALQKEYQDQLRLTQEEIGFSYIRGHGLFSDDMAIYHTYKDADGNLHEEYNFTYLDLVMDSYLEKHIRPFLELGFMPKDMASGDQTVFYWKGNTTPPVEYARWQRLVQATLRHLISRYSLEEVLTWPIEVWNEPNLPGFWKGADMPEYFRLFEATFTAIKEVNVNLKVGGPAICGVEDERWIGEFMKFCSEKKIPLDFVTRHHYTTDLPVPDGHYGYPPLREHDGGFAELQVTRDIIDSYPEYKGLLIHITEFNTSYVPNAPLHDTNKNAAYVACMLTRLGDVNESYSYWTFGDIFEEQGVPFTPFHGGFGLVANGCIPKPTFWTFAFFKKLFKACVLKERNVVLTRDEETGAFRGIAFNDSTTRKGETLSLTLELPLSEGRYVLITKTVDEETCNPLKVWHDLGEPSSLSKEEKSLLIEAAKPLVKTEVLVPADGKVLIPLTVKEYGMVAFEVRKAELKPDRGYSFDRANE